MNINFIKNALGWGAGLWFIGYVLGILLFAFVPVSLIGWIISPIGVLITLWVLLTRIRSLNIHYYFWLGAAWALIAVGFDYLFLVKLFKPVDGYYKLDVYVYYLATFILPIVVGWFKTKNKRTNE